MQSRTFLKREEMFLSFHLSADEDSTWSSLKTLEVFGQKKKSSLEY